MAFRRTANAIIAHPGIEFDRWMDEYRQQHEGIIPKDHIGRIAKTVLTRCNPKQYLLSHATVVASVDTYSPKGFEVGKFINRGAECNRKWLDFRIKPECQELINNNGDAWNRPLLLATYRSFIGAPNYLEHIQIPELSKGFIVDAIARDLGKTCYIDILLATDRKHEILVRDILAGDINSVSMGCISQFTICTKCGNVAVDDSDLCPCILYDGKHNKFLDESGTEHIIAELIGHISIPNSNQFIETSWVRNPAFSGAQRRNILNPDVSAIATKMNESFNIYELELKRNYQDMDGLLKAASVKIAQDEPIEESPVEEPVKDEVAEFEAAEDEVTGDKEIEDEEKLEEGSTEEIPKAHNDKMQEFIEKAQELLLESLVKGLADKLTPQPEDVGTVTPALSDMMTYNDNLVQAFNRDLTKIFANKPKIIKWASKAYKIVHVGGVKAIKASKLTAKDLIVLSWIEDIVKHRAYDPMLYKIAMNVGSINSYPSEKSYMAACRMKLGRTLTQKEQGFLKWKGRLASLSNI
jgi:hypothetical protein